MKPSKYYLIIIFLTFCSGGHLFAQFTTSGTNTSTSNRVGIGTTDPQGNLHIAGAFQNQGTGIQDGNDRPSLSITGNYPELVLMAGGVGNVNHGSTISLGAFDSGTSGTFKSWTLGTPGTNATFMDIGYGTNGNPHVNGMAGYGTTVVRLTNTGNVGIGTLNPTSKLHLVGPLDGSLSALNIGDASSGNINVPVGTSTGGYNIDFNTWRDVVPNQIGARIRAERINNYSPNSALIQSMDLVFSTSNGVDQSNLTEKLRIRSDGNVGIGTTSPDAKLAVNGTIHAKEVKVSLNVPGPDYVFEKNYKLKTLAEVQNYIAENKHLPEIPSAKSMEQSGVDLSEMNMALLKKVEELTLYLIDIKKEDELLKKGFNHQKKQIKQLTYKIIKHK